MKSRNRFSASLRNANKKTDNNPAALGAKVQIRDNVLAAIGADRAGVFDAFAGEGVLHRRVWARANYYVGCDKIWYRDERRMFVADSRRVMRAVDLARFNIFDMDSHGSPWEHIVILCARRRVAPGERIGVVLTEGSGLKLKMGGLPHALAAIAGLKPSTPGASHAFAFILDRAITGMCQRMACQIVSRWQGKGRTGASVYYVGLVLEGIRPAAIVPASKAPKSSAERGRRRSARPATSLPESPAEPAPAQE